MPQLVPTTAESQRLIGEEKMGQEEEGLQTERMRKCVCVCGGGWREGRERCLSKVRGGERI